MSCEICAQGLDLSAKIELLYAEGIDLHEISSRFNLTHEALVSHCTTCIKPPRSRAERCKDLIDELDDARATAYEAMIGAKRPSPGLQQGYARLAQEYRDALKEFEGLVKPEDIVRDVLLRVVNPIVRDLMKVHTEEIDQLRIQLEKLDLPHDTITKILEESFRRTIIKLKQAVEPAVANLSSYFGVKGQDTVQTIQTVNSKDLN